MRAVDLNADLGEGDAYDNELLEIVSSCNIACGGHTGDANSMRVTATAAMANEVAIGAHPGYPDRGGFGRRSRFVEGDELKDSLVSQICALKTIVEDLGAALSHVKPHGALYNDAVKDRTLADTIANAIKEAAPQAKFVGLPDSEMQNAARHSALEFIGEGFVDRAYRSDGQLVPRSEPGAVHDSPDQVVSQAASLVGRVDTLCIHGDTPCAAALARAVRESLENKGVAIRAVGR